MPASPPVGHRREYLRRPQVGPPDPYPHVDRRPNREVVGMAWPVFVADGVVRVRLDRNPVPAESCHLASIEQVVDISNPRSARRPGLAGISPASDESYPPPRAAGPQRVANTGNSVRNTALVLMIEYVVWRFNEIALPAIDDYDIRCYFT
jgi:hypothetical protein